MVVSSTSPFDVTRYKPVGGLPLFKGTEREKDAIGIEVAGCEHEVNACALALNDRMHIDLKHRMMHAVMLIQADFDVRWCKGPVAERLFKPLIANIESRGGHVLGGRRVSQVQTLGKAACTRYSCSESSCHSNITKYIGCKLPLIQPCTSIRAPTAADSAHLCLDSCNLQVCRSCSSGSS